MASQHDVVQFTYTTEKIQLPQVVQDVNLNLNGQATTVTKKMSNKNRTMPSQRKGAEKISNESLTLSGFYHPAWHQDRSIAKSVKLSNKSLSRQVTNPDLKSGAQVHGPPDSLLFRSKTMPGGMPSMDAAAQPSKTRKLPAIVKPQAPKDKTENLNSTRFEKHHSDLESDYKGCHFLLESGTWHNIRRHSQMALTEFVRIVDPKPLHVSPQEATSRSFRESLRFLEKYYKSQEKGDPNRIRIPDGSQHWKVDTQRSKSVSFEDFSDHGTLNFPAIGGACITPAATPRKDYNPALSPISEIRNRFSASTSASVNKRGGPWWKQHTAET